MSMHCGVCIVTSFATCAVHKFQIQRYMSEFQRMCLVEDFFFMVVICIYFFIEIVTDAIPNEG